MLIPAEDCTPESLPLNFSDGNSMCGSLRIQLETTAEETLVSIWNVRIGEEFRGRGLGQQMMKEALEFIVETFPQADIVYLTVAENNNRARHIYEKLGFSYVPLQPEEEYWALPMEIPMKNLIGEMLCPSKKHL